jgi:hypothetical protein
MEYPYLLGSNPFTERYFKTSQTPAEGRNPFAVPAGFHHSSNDTLTSGAKERCFIPIIRIAFPTPHEQWLTTSHFFPQTFPI